MTRVKTPCIGICSTTSLGDKICRGCKRAGFEVIQWNAYSEEQKLAVLSRISQLSEQIIRNYFVIESLQKLQDALHDYRFFYDVKMSPYCWLLNLLQKRGHMIDDITTIGVQPMPVYRGRDQRELLAEINEEILTLSAAHFDRYFPGS